MMELLIEGLKGAGLPWSIPSISVTTPHHGNVEVRYTKSTFVVWSEDGNMRLGSFRDMDTLLDFLQNMS